MPTPVVPPGPEMRTRSATPGARMRTPAPLAPGQYSTPRARVRISHLFERPKSLHFPSNPLPPPPEAILEQSPYIRLIQELRRDPGEILHRSASAPLNSRYANVVPPRQDDSYARRERKHRKGLFRTLSDALTGKSRREQTRHRIPTTFTTGPPPSQYRPHSTPAHTGVGHSGATSGMARAPSVRMPSPVPSNHGPPRVASPARSTRARSPQRQIMIHSSNEYAGLVHFSHHPVDYKGHTYPSAYHLLEALKFIEDHPEISETIRQCSTLEDVRSVVSRALSLVRPDWEHIVVRMVNDLSYTCFHLLIVL